MLQFFLGIGVRPMIRLQFAKGDKFQRAVLRRYRHTDVLPPEAQPLLTDAAGRKHLEGGMLIIAHKAQAVRNPLIELGRLTHCADLNAQFARCIECFNSNRGQKRALLRIHGSRPAPSLRIAADDQFRSQAVQFALNLSVGHPSHLADIIAHATHPGNRQG